MQPMVPNLPPIVPLSSLPLLTPMHVFPLPYDPSYRPTVLPSSAEFPVRRYIHCGQSIVMRAMERSSLEAVEDRINSFMKTAV